MITSGTMIDALLVPSLALLALAVFLDQVGVPLPALPVLLLAGAAGARGEIDVGSALAVGVASATLADLLWYAAGRRVGGRVLGTLCRLSLSPDGCVRQAETLYERYGVRVLLVAKFVPGVAAVATALAGTTRVPVLRFLAWDALGACLWVGTMLLVGWMFAEAVTAVVVRLADFGAAGLALVAMLLAGYLIVRAWRRWLLLRTLRMTRIEVSELRDRLSDDSPPLVLDVRSALRQAVDGRIPGALSLPTLDADLAPLGPPGEREVIVYCACPSEASAVQVARRLRAAGFRRVRPLAGGIDAWRAAGYAVEDVAS